MTRLLSCEEGALRQGGGGGGSCSTDHSAECANLVVGSDLSSDYCMEDITVHVSGRVEERPFYTVVAEKWQGCFYSFCCLR